MVFLISFTDQDLEPRICFWIRKLDPQHWLKGSASNFRIICDFFVVFPEDTTAKGCDGGDRLGALQRLEQVTDHLNIITLGPRMDPWGTPYESSLREQVTEHLNIILSDNCQLKSSGNHVFYRQSFLQ